MEWTSDCGQYRMVNGDSIEFLKSMKDAEVAAVVTDPPYGIDYSSLGSFSEKHGWTQFGYCEWDKVRIRREYFDEMRRVSKQQIIWGGNYYTDVLPPSMQWLVWDKGQRDFSLADCELAWSSKWAAARVFNYGRWKANKEARIHPTQKPVAVIDWCLSFLEHGVVLDPFCGSGTTLVAAYRRGFPAIGIEAEKPMFDKAVARLKGEIEGFRHPLFKQMTL